MWNLSGGEYRIDTHNLGSLVLVFHPGNSLQEVKPLLVTSLNR